MLQLLCQQFNDRKGGRPQLPPQAITTCDCLSQSFLHANFHIVKITQRVLDPALIIQHYIRRIFPASFVTLSFLRLP